MYSVLKNRTELPFPYTFLHNRNKSVLAAFIQIPAGSAFEDYE